MIYYINVNKKRIVGRNNQISTRPLNLEYDVTEVIDFQFIDDNNQIQPLSPQTAGLTLAIGLKQNMPSYDLLALSHDYEIVNGQTLRFTVNTYTVNWLKKINKPNTEVFIEISQQSLESKKVWLRDYCYVWPRVWVAGLSPEEIQSKDYWTASETQEYVDNAIEEATSGIVISGYVTEEQFEEGLATKQNTIDDENKLAYELLSGTPTIPTKTSDLDNDSGFITEDALSGYATETALSTHTSDTVIHVTAEDKEAWNGKQDAITVDNKLDYALLSGTPEVPTNVSDFTNDAGYQTAQDVQDAISGKQDAIDNNNKLDYALISGAPTVPTSTSQLTNDSDFIDQTALETALSGKQDAITNDNKLDYGLLSGIPTIPLSTSQLTNDSDFATSGYVDGEVSGKLDKSDYVAPYRLPYNAGSNAWLEEDIGVTLAWSDQDIIPNDRKIVIVAYTDNGDDHLVFPTLIATADENVIKTCEVWVKMAGNTTEAQGIAAIVVPNSYYIVDEANFPTSLKGEATNSEAYTYHVFVIRAVPRQSGTLCEVAYSHYINTNLSI